MRVDKEILTILSLSSTDGKALVLPEQLDRNMYVRTNKVLEAAGGKWNKKAGAHLFDADASSRIEQIILSGAVEVPKDEYNFFPSPPAVVARMLALANIRHGMRVLEPNAGRGAIAFACIEAGASVDCCELMDENFAVLRDDPRLSSVIHGDFLDQQPTPVYDRIVMNPPFLKQADIKHVQHAHRFLKPDGVLVSAMAASITFRDNRLTQDFRDFVMQRGGEIESLPEGSFKPSGTMVSSVLVTIPA